MKKSLFAFFALLSLAFAKAQTADEIIAKHIDAIGGKDKIAQINSMYMESSMSVMGNDVPVKIYIVNGKDYKTESDFNGQSIVTVIKDNSGWQINPYAGASDPTALGDDEYKSRADEIYTPDPLVNYAANGGKVELSGQEKVGDINAYKIKYTNKYGMSADYYIDPATWYIIQTVTTGYAMGQQTTVTTTYSNYKPTDFGVALANTIHMDTGQFSFDMTTNKVEVNKDIDPAIFEMKK